MGEAAAICGADCDAWEKKSVGYWALGIRLSARPASFLLARRRNTLAHCTHFIALNRPKEILC